MIKQEDLKDMPTAKSLESENRQTKMNVVVGNLDKDKKPIGAASAIPASTMAGGAKP